MFLFVVVVCPSGPPYFHDGIQSATGLDFSWVKKVELQHKGSTPLYNQSREEGRVIVFSSQSLSPGKSGTTGRTVETLYCKK